MKKYLLPETGTFYKANLHSHSTVSDGEYTPEELKALYKAQGYSVFAYTDHHVMVPHPELADEAFLPLTGYELNICDHLPFTIGCRIHMNLIALDPDNVTQPFINEGNMTHPKFADRYKESMKKITTDDSLIRYTHTYTHEYINEVMRIARERGFYVIYNHPTWSLESYPQYSGYEGMHAFEICNYAAASSGHDEHNGRVYDDLLRLNKRIFCVAADDTHKQKDLFGGFTMIKADKLDYKTITNALVAGNFYASEGPIIHKLWYEDGEVHITFDPAKRVLFGCGSRQKKIAEGEDLITEASFTVPEECIYFRLTVVAENGDRAYTNAYFLDELI